MLALTRKPDLKRQTKKYKETDCLIFVDVAFLLQDQVALLSPPRLISLAFHYPLRPLSWKALRASALVQQQAATFIAKLVMQMK